MKRVGREFYDGVIYEMRIALRKMLHVERKDVHKQWCEEAYVANDLGIIKCRTYFKNRLKYYEVQKK